MYTGIVQAVQPIARIAPYAGGREITVSMPEALRRDLALGASVSIEGVCLSVTKMEGDLISFDAMDATLERTNLGRLAAGGRANVERSARPTDENGGHVIAGHIATTAEIVEIDTAAAQAFLRFRVPEPWAKYVFLRGFLAVNGCSLTVAEEEGGGVFRINLIPETIRQTTFADYRKGDAVNIEVDHQTMVMVDTIERTMSAMMPGLIAKALAERAA